MQYNIYNTILNRQCIAQMICYGYDFDIPIRMICCIDIYIVLSKELFR
jgi:hypothetical protein